MKVLSDGRPAEVTATVHHRLRDPEVRRRTIAWMRLLRRDGLSDREIAARYGCTRGTVNRLINSREGEGS